MGLAPSGNGENLRKSVEQRNEPAWVGQSAREIPVAYDVDVWWWEDRPEPWPRRSKRPRPVRACCSPRRDPYLGDDICGRLQFWLEPGEQAVHPLAKEIFADGPYRPLHVKRVLDQALLDAGVSFLFGCLVTDVLVDSSGAVSGSWWPIGPVGRRCGPR
jgi:hypothetical protein